MSPWPFAAAVSSLTSPVYDSVSTNIFAGTSNGNLHRVTSAGANCSTALISVAAGTSPGAVVDAPIVDSSAQTVFATANNAANAVLMQATTALGSPVRATMGMDGTDLYDGSITRTSQASVADTCTSVGTSRELLRRLWRVTFNSSGTMNSTNDGSSFQLVTSGNKGQGEDCTPLTEVFNTSQNKTTSSWT